MKLYVNEKLFSIHRKFYIQNENNERVFEISSKIFTVGDEITINDINGNRIAHIEQELFHIMPNYNIFINDNFVCKITKKFRLFKNDYLLSNGYRVDGTFWMLDFAIYNKINEKIGSISKKLFSIGDKYEVDILDEKETKMILAIVVAIANDVNENQRTRTRD